MKEQRYNVFNMIHKALRALFYETAITIQRTDFDQPEALETIKKIRYILELLEDHSQNEDLHILPLIREKNPGLWQEFHNDHEVDHKLCEELQAHIDAWEKASSAWLKMEAGAGIFMAFNEFIAFNLYHMNKEESILLLCLWKEYSDEDLLVVQRQIIAGIKPETLIFENEWMIRSISNGELINWLKGVRLSAPEEVFHRLMTMALSILPPERFFRLQKVMDEELVIS